MAQRSVTHATFVLERTYDTSPTRVFAAWADPEAKARWMGGPDEKPDEYELDFRVGGREYNRGTLPGGGPVFTYEARYQDIVADHRIVYTYEMYLDDARISVSVGTVQLAPAGPGTRLTYTEQGAYLDGLDNPKLREQGTAEALDSLGVELRRQSATA